MKSYGVVALMLSLLLAGCVEQNENLVDPEQALGPSQSQVGRDYRVALPPAANPSLDVSPADLIPGDAEAVYDPPGERIKVYTDFETFDEATGELTLVTFDDLPHHGSSCPSPGGGEDSLPNPLIREGIEFADPWCLESWYCPEQTCPGSGILLVIHTLATIDFPPETGGVMLAVEGIGDGPFVLRAEGWSGGVVTVTHHGVSSGTSYIGFTSLGGIAQIQFLGAITHGNLPLRRVYFESD